MCATFATGGFHGTKYCREVDFGITPANPAMRNLRHTSNNMVLSKDSFQSNELRDDAQISDLRHGNKQAGGDLGIEFSFAEYDDFLAAAVRGEWKDNPDIPGQKYLIAGIKQQSFTIERVFNDVKQYQHFTGMEVNTFNFTVAPNAMVTGSFGFIGSGVDFKEEPLDSDPDPSFTYPPFDGFQGKLIEGGLVNAVVTSMEVNIDNGMEAAFVIGSDIAEAIVGGRINITGTISAYFQNMDLLRKFVDELETSLQFTLGNGIHTSYVITLPRVKYSGGDNPVDSEGPVVLNMPFQALYDECSGTNIRIDRIPPLAAVACELVYSGTSFKQSTTTPGTFDETINVTITGGNGMKTFTGAFGQPIPGVVFTGLPAGITGAAIKLTANMVGIRLTGKATSAITAGSFTVEFTAVSIMFGYCHCPGDSAVGSTKTLTIVV